MGPRRSCSERVADHCQNSRGDTAASPPGCWRYIDRLSPQPAADRRNTRQCPTRNCRPHHPWSSPQHGHVLARARCPCGFREDRNDGSIHNRATKYKGTVCIGGSLQLKNTLGRQCAQTRGVGTAGCGCEVISKGHGGRVWQEVLIRYGAALEDRPLKQSRGGRRYYVRRSIYRTCRLAAECDVVGIAAEGCDVGTNPAKRGLLIQNAVIGEGMPFRIQIGFRQEAKQAHTIVDRYDHGGGTEGAACGDFAPIIIVGFPVEVSAAMYPNQDGLWRSASPRREDVEIEAVLSGARRPCKCTEFGDLRTRVCKLSGLDKV